MRRYRRALAILLAVSLLLGMSAFPAAAAAELVSDMPAETDWAYPALKAAMDNDLLRGDGGRLRPEALLTRSQLAAIVVRAFGARTAAEMAAYADVAASAWYHDDMARSVAMGVLNGSGGLLRPEDSVTRQEAFTILARAMKLSGGPASALDAYSDSTGVAAWAEDAMASLISGGYVRGNGAGLNPTAFITRAEFAQVMNQLVSSYIDKAGVYDKANQGTVMVRAGGVTLKGVSLTRDLILGDGIGDGDVTLDSVTVAGRTVIRGGGTQAILVKGSSSLGAVIIDRPAGGVALKLQDKATVGSITVCSDGVALSGIPKGTSVTVNQGVTGVTLEGLALPAGTSVAPGTAAPSGGGGGGGNPPVSAVATTTLTVSPAAQTMAAGAYETLIAARNTGANDALAWSSSDETVAVVDAFGKVGARKSGEAVIAVQSASGVVASATVYVQAPTGDSITISVPGTVLTGGSYTKITVAASVGTGDYTLNGVTVATLETHGGGIHSGHIDGGSVGTIDIQGTPGEGSRVLLSGGTVVGTVNVAGTAGGAALEVAQGDSASVGSVTAHAALTVTNAVVTTGITAASGVSLINSSTPELTTSGEVPVFVAINGSSVITLNAGAAGGTTVSGGKGGATLPLVNASGSVTTEANVGVGAICGAPSAPVPPVITVNGPVGSITGTAGLVSLNNSGNTAITADAHSVSVSGISAPVVSGTVASGIMVDANPAGSAGVTVLAGSPSINTTGTGTVGQISVGGSAAPTITANAPIKTVTVTDTAAPTVGGTAPVDAVVSSSSGTTTVSNTNTAAVLAADTTRVGGAGAENKTQAAVVTLQSVAVTTYPAKLNYAVGGTLNTAGMVVTGYYTVTGFDGTVSKVMKDTDYTVGAVDMASAGTKTVTVTAADAGKTASFPISVVEKTVGLVAVTKLPTKLVYEKGESLDLAGGKLTVAHTDSSLYSNAEVSLTDGAVSVSGYQASIVGVQTLTAAYAGKTARFTVTVKDSLGEAQAAAKNELNAYAAVQLASASFTAVGRAAIEGVRKSGIDTITAAEDSAGVSAALSSAKAAINAVPNQDKEWTAAAVEFRSYAILGETPETVQISAKAAVNQALVAYAALEAGVQAKLTAEKAKLDGLLAKIATLEAAQTLDAAKAAATTTLNTAYANYNIGYGANHTDIDTAKSAGLAAIEAATSVSAVTAALNQVLAAMAAVKSDAALLAEAKTAAKSELNTYAAARSTGDYDAAGKAAIESARKSGEAAITAAGSRGAVDSALASAKDAIATVKTAAQVAAAKLLAAKAAATAELTAYGNPSLYSGSQKTAFDSAKTQGAHGIAAAADIAAVAAALSAAKAAVAAVKTDAQVAAETLAGQKTAAAATLNAYWGDGGATEESYTAAGKAIIASQRQVGLIAITAAGDSTGVDTALASAKTAIDSVKTAAEENSAAVSDAKALADAIAIPAAAQAVCGTEGLAKEYAGAKVAAAIKNPAISVTVTTAVWIPPAAGTAGSAAGTDGVYQFTATLAKAGTTAVTAVKSFVITATAYSDADAVSAALTAVNGAVYAPVAEGDVNSETAAEIYVKGIAAAAIGNSPVTVTVNKAAFTPAVAGSKENAAGVNGSYGFTVTVSKGEQSRTSNPGTLVITATKLISRADVAAMLYEALKNGYGLDDGTTVTHHFADVGGLPAETRTAISFCFNNKLASGVSDTAFEPAAAVTRAEAAALLSRIPPQLTGFELGRAVDLDGKYTDVAANAWYHDPVMAMGGAGVFPAEDLFRPADLITPGEFTGAMDIFSAKIAALYATAVRVSDGAGLVAALGKSGVQRITLADKVVLGQNATLGAGKTLFVGPNTALIIGENVTFGTEAGSTIRNDSMILVSGGAVLNNAGTIEGRWVDAPDSDDPSIGWYESSVVTDLIIGRKLTGTVNNTGTIRDTLLVSDYLADTSGGDILGRVVNTNPGKIARLRPAAVVETTAALKRALANPNYAEIDGLGRFTLTESVTVPEYVLLLFPKAWEEDGKRTENALTVAPAATLTIAGGAELSVSCDATIEGAVENRGYFSIRGSGKVTGGIRVNNSGTIEAESVYAQGDRMQVALDGCTGSGELRHTAYVYDGSLLGAAAGNTSVNTIITTAERASDGTRAVAIGGNITIRPDVSLSIPVFVDDSDPAGVRQPVTLVIPDGASLTVNGSLNVVGIVEVREGGTLVLNGEASLREKRNESYQTFGTLKSAGSVTLGENAVLDCGGDIITTGTFTNNGEIRIHPTSGTGYPQYGTVTGTISGHTPVSIAVVHSEAELRAALANQSITAIRTVGNMTLAGDLSFTKPTTVSEGELTVINHSLTVESTVTVTQNGTLNFHAGENGGLLTVNAGATLRALDGGRLIIGDADGNTSSAKGSVVNRGSIESRRAEVSFVEAEEWEILTTDSNPVVYYASRADLARTLGLHLKDYLVSPTDEELNGYARQYSDWRDMSEDEGARRGFGLLIKNGLVAGTAEGCLAPYEDLDYSALKTLLIRIADKLLGEDYENSAMDAFLARITQTGPVTYSHQKYTDGNQHEYWDNGLNKLTRDFTDALGLYRADVDDVEKLEAALEKPYVTEIHITQDLALPAATEGEARETTLTGVREKERVVIVNTGVTITIPEGARLTVEQGVTLELSGKLVNNGGMDVFGGLQPGDWQDSTRYEQGESAYINFYPDFLTLAQQLYERVSDHGLEADPEEIDGKERDNWPNGDDREAAFAVLVKYGGVQTKTEDGHTWWPTYDKVTYGELKGILTHLRQAIYDDGNTEPLPDSVSLNGKENEYLVSEGELNTMLALFVLTLPRVEDGTGSVTASAAEEPVHFFGKRFTQKVTVNCNDTNSQDDWGGDVIFENCEFVEGLEIKLGGVSYAVSLQNCAVVTVGSGVVVSPAWEGTPDPSGEIWLKLRDVPNGQTVTATAPIDVSGRAAGGGFTLNGVSVTGAAELGEDTAYGAALRLKTYDGEGSSFQCGKLHLHGEVEHVEVADTARFAGHAICTYEFFDRQGAVSLNVGTLNVLGTENPVRIRNNSEGSTLTVTGTVTGGVELSSGEIDVSGLALTGSRIFVGTWDSGVTAHVGAHETELVGGGEKPVTIYAAEGAVIQMESLPAEYIDNLTVKLTGSSGESLFPVGVPHIFGVENGHQVFVGTTDQGMEFEVYQGDQKLTTTTAYVNDAGQSAEEGAATKVHLSFEIQPENLNDMTLHMSKGGVTLIIRLALKEKPETQP